MNSITEIWEQLAYKYGKRIALKDANTGYSLSFIELNETINKFTQIFENLNLEINCKILLCMKSLPLWHVTDQAIMNNNFISVLCDSMSSYLEVKYFVESMQIKILCTDSIKLVENFSKEKNLTHIFYMGSTIIDSYNNENLRVFNILKEIENVKYEPNKKQEHLPNTVVSIMFSSGTTGKHKGSMFTHENLLSSFYDYRRILCSVYEKSCVNMLSLAHVAPRLNEWALLSNGSTIIYTDYVNYLETIKQYKPYYLMCVPKLLDTIIKQYKNELLNISKVFRILNKFMFYIARGYYILKFKYSKNIIVKLMTEILSVVNIVCYNCFIKNIVGKFMNSKSSIIAFGALTDKNVENIIGAMGLNLMIQYGMTEASVISFRSQEYKKAYSVGKINKNMDIIICDIETGKKLKHNETGIIKVKGKQIMTGYYNNEKDTKEAFDSEGYFITGDLGYISDDKFLYFVGRYKNIIVLNNGENVDSVKIEQICNNSAFIQQIVVFGQDKPYLTAVVILNDKYTRKWAKDKNIDITTQYGKSLLKKDIIIDINNLISKNKFFRWIEQVKDITIINELFTIENGLLTRKYTVVRSKVYNKYKNLIEEMYK